MFVCMSVHKCVCVCVCVFLTIWARRYICAWLAVRVEFVGLPSSTACWDIPAGAELTLWARLMS